MATRDNNPSLIAIVGVGAVLPDAPTANQFWENIKEGRYSVSDVPEDRWDPDLFFDPDPKAPAKTYSRIGGWVQDWEWDPLRWRLPIPPKVAAAMDRAQKWSVAGTRQALTDYGYPERALDRERTAVIIGNAMAGDQHYLTAIRIFLPEYEQELARCETFSDLDPALQTDIRREFGERIAAHFPEITEDSMPGELGNIIAGRVANLFDLHGPNYVTDAACASAMAAMSAAIEGLEEHDFDVVITGGVDANMSASTFTKFCKIGALSATGTRPYAEGADGFVMGEGAALFVLKRLEDAVENDDRIYALIRSVAGASDGRGKGITAPNPVGQRLAVERAWQRAGLAPDEATLIEGHGTSTRVGDVVEVESLDLALSSYGLGKNTIPIGSVKSNIGHLKGAAGAAGVLKAAYSLRDRVLPPSIGCEVPNTKIDFGERPFFVNRELRDWDTGESQIRRAGVSAFGFGGTNFHVVLEEYRPGASLAESRPVQTSVGALPERRPSVTAKAPLRGGLVLGGSDEAELLARLRPIAEEAAGGRAPDTVPPPQIDLNSSHRLAIDYADAADLAKKAGKAITNLENGRPEAWKALRARGIFYGQGSAPKVAMLFTGQGSQYLNMLRDLRRTEPIVAETFDEADAVMEPLLGRPLTEYLFIDSDDPEELKVHERELRQTAITQPAVLSVDIALQRLLAAYGIMPHFVMGHSLGEYGALVAAGAMDFRHALKAVSARGWEMSKLEVDDPGGMAAVFAPLEEIERILESVDGYVVVANLNSPSEAVIGGETQAVEKAIGALNGAGYDAKALPVSHAFHTQIVAPVSDSLRGVLEKMGLEPPSIPIVSNVTGEFYPMGPGVQHEMIDLLAQQVASPVQFVKGLQTLYRAGARVFVEVGPKRALQGMARGLFQKVDDVLSLSTNHPRLGGVVSFNQALCGLWASGLGVGESEVSPETESMPLKVAPAPAEPNPVAPPIEPAEPVRSTDGAADTYLELGKMFAGVLEKGMALYAGERPTPPKRPVVITGASLGLPGGERVFDDRNAEKLLTGRQFIGPIPESIRQGMVDKNITRLVKSDRGGPRFETIADPAEVIKLAARAGELDLVQEFGYPADRSAALDVVTQLAIGAGLEALRDAGIPLVRRYKTTTKGTKLPDTWGLPNPLRDETGVIFASAFPGIDFFAEESRRYYEDRSRQQRLADLTDLRAAASDRGEEAAVADLDARIADLEAAMEADPYTFERRFLFKLLSMGHSQFAELIGARGPNTQLNAACASGTQAVSLAEDWIRAGRCRRVVVISADNVTSDQLLEWIGAGFLATGAAATDEVVEDAAIPFDRRRHGMIVGMGAAAIVVESSEAAAERGLQPIGEVLSTVTRNSAFHGTRLDVEHISGVMEDLIAKAERDWGIDRHQIAGRTVFISHETYTPARGGSAQAEVFALRRVFGSAADQIVIANTKGYTGHPMGVAIEDVLAVKSLETGLVPPVANIKEIDPELGNLNLSSGGHYPVDYALRLGAGFGSQISMSLVRLVPSHRGRRPGLHELGYDFRLVDPERWNRWLEAVSGYSTPQLEVDRRVLRVRDEGPPAEVPMDLAVPSDAPPPEAPTPAVAPPPPPAPVAEPMPAVPAAPSSAVDPVAQRILVLVAEMTGYPEDMLDLELDMEADLGIDTVKQAEMFAAIREEWDIPRDDNLQLRDFPTLAHAIQFVYDRRPDLAKPTGVETGASAAAPAQTTPVATSPAPEPDSPEAAEAPGAATQQPTTSPVDGDPVANRVLSLVAELTGYPEDMLDLDLDMEADLGIDTVKQAEMFAAIREVWDIPRDDNLQLRDFPTLAHAIQFVYERRPDLVSEQTTGDSAVPAASVPAEAPAGEDPVAVRILSLVAELTGYPEDMLDLDLDMEADLGIDTVKQAEMFAAIREEWGIPRDDNLQLRDFPTLAHAIQFVYDRKPDLGAAQEASEEDSAPTEASPGTHESQPSVAVPRRVPIAKPRPPIDLFKSTGVSPFASSRLVIMPDEGGVGLALARKLDALGAEVVLVEGEPQPAELADLARQWLEAGPVDGVFWLPALDGTDRVADSSSEEWWATIDRTVKCMHSALQVLWEALGEPGKFLITGTRMGGRHGYDEAGAQAPIGGAVSGFSKAFKRERPTATVKVVDFDRDAAASVVADRLMAETLRDPGVVEIGYRGENRWTVGLEERSKLDSEAIASLPERPVFLVTGAAGSIVSAIVADLAKRWPGHFYLADLTAEPDPDDPDLELFRKDRDALKRRLFERLKSAGEKATPAAVERQLAGFERSLAAIGAVSAVEQAGGSAHYRSVDLLDEQAVAVLVDQIGKEHGRIDVVIHAAGIEISRFLPDKSAQEFDLVFDVKAGGWFHLMKSARNLPIAATVVFTSIAGRFGNGGQTDYSSANDLLCKLSTNLRSTRPETRGIAIDWSAWAQIGMASRGSIPKMMEQAGIDMVPPEIGVPIVSRELAGSPGEEIVVAGSLGALLDEWDATGGLDTEALGKRFDGPMLGSALRLSLYGGFAAEVELDPTAQPFLFDHRIDGTAVLPGVMGIEAFGELASAAFPGHQIVSVENVEFMAPFKFYRDEPRVLVVEADFRGEGDEIIASCRLLGRRFLAKGERLEETEHFVGEVRMAPSERESETLEIEEPSGGTALDVEPIYRVYFHGPAYRVLSGAGLSNGALQGRFAADLPSNHLPPEAPTVLSPRVVELCFQTAGLMEICATGRVGLPRQIERLEVFPDLRETTSIRAVVQEVEGDRFRADVVDPSGRVLMRLEGYSTVESPLEVDAEALEQMQAALSISGSKRES